MGKETRRVVYASGNVIYYRINDVLDVKKTEIKTIFLIFVYVIIFFIFKFKYLYTCIKIVLSKPTVQTVIQYGLYLDLHCYALKSQYRCFVCLI